MSNEIEHVTADVGRVVPLFKGDYDADTQYELNDIVRYNNRLYWHTSVELTTGFAPTDDTVWKEAFVVLVDIDDELTEEGYAADAKAAGNAIAEVNLLIERSLTAEEQAQVRGNIGLALDAGNNYSKLPDGTLICYGRAYNGGEGFATVNFAQAFKDVDFAFTATAGYIYGMALTLNAVTQKTSVNSGTVYLYNSDGSYPNSTSVFVDYIAIGRWK